ncbi:hypothetical protein Xmau_00813 [Xenorhabdus mauleonii]|uniref:Uncharacterized protein n=1 Tax=Xenorhabdus mauleonii TaxID=351675 RepID=A0A1I3RUP1_9GAMM|nr:hypothetical protein Xmau_00813 [Xenorhabdus mauleonii]SFJ50283.1 hypothetical protein SAMN05421680_11079 [Xenorhabdus mauleonii]
MHISQYKTLEEMNNINLSLEKVMMILGGGNYLDLV